MRQVATRDIRVLNVACNDDERHLKPTQAAIEGMMKSLQEYGQIHPISVYQIVRGQYRLIAGATRFRAASALKWEFISATIWSGSAVEYKIHELAENVDRRELTGAQRRDMKARLKELQRERLAAVAPAEGGRGKKGGVSEEARQMGVSRTTARRRQDETKPGRSDHSGQVSAVRRDEDCSATMHINRHNREKLDAWARKHNMNRSTAMWTIIRERLEAEEANYDDEHPEPTGARAAH